MHTQIDNVNTPFNDFCRLRDKNYYFAVPLKKEVPVKSSMAKKLQI